MENSEGWNFKISTISSPEGAVALEIVDAEMRFHEEIYCLTYESGG